MAEEFKTCFVTALPVVSIAAACHEANRVHCELFGDTSQPIWAEAPEWQRNSAIAGVELHLANPTLPDSASHDAWSEHKYADGWVYGPIKDADAKTHPCLVPYADLPVQDKLKDALFKAIVHVYR